MKKIFITFDMEWVCDEVLEYLYRLLTDLDIKSTICVTHNTKWLDVFRKDDKIELGIHPNFNPLLNGNLESTEDFRNIIRNLKNIVPEAKTLRSHSLVTGSRVLEGMEENGIVNELNMYIPPESGNSIKPFNIGNIKRIPFLFEDDVYLVDKDRGKAVYSADYLLGSDFDMYRIFNFHPNLLFLNVDKMERYERSKPYYKDWENLKTYRNSLNNGIENLFKSIIEKGKKENFEFLCIKDIV